MRDGASRRHSGTGSAARWTIGRVAPRIGDPEVEDGPRLARAFGDPRKSYTRFFPSFLRRPGALGNHSSKVSRPCRGSSSRWHPRCSLPAQEVTAMKPFHREVFTSLASLLATASVSVANVSAQALTPAPLPSPSPGTSSGAAAGVIALVILGLIAVIGF